MNTRQDDRIVNQWLDAEALGHPDEADRLFTALAAAHWSRLEAPAGLASRIVAAAVAARPVWWELWWVRVLVVSSLLVVGGTFALVPSPALGSAGVSAIVVWSRLLAAAMTASELAIQIALGAWAFGARLSSWMGVVLSAPLAQLLVALNLALAAGASVALRRLLRSEEMPS